MDEHQYSQAIVCVDDEAVILMHIVMILRQEYGNDWLIEKASDARKGLSIIEKLHQSGFRRILIVSDWMMQEINGEEFIGMVHLRFPEIKAILISGKIQQDQSGEVAIPPGFAGFLPKPIIAEKLVSLIDYVLAENNFTGAAI